MTLPRFASFGLLRFMRAMTAHGGEVTLRMRSRPEVASRLWFTLEWRGEDGVPHTVVASDDQLLIRRALAIEDAEEDR